ncbi:MAG: P1 family peptidase [Lachnospiraceae bacterium]|nr:P1 family peptidase [Lachnospiraceae bacterium]
MKEINIKQIPEFRIGNAQNTEGATGCTVVICEKGARAGVSVKGGGPATRETDLLDPQKMVQEIFGLCISGGSAYGLDSATGVMKYLEEKKIGFDVGMGIVPIVPAACLFDLITGDFQCRPDADMGYSACVDSEKWSDPAPFTGGNKGAGTGATVGKFKGLDHLMKSGLGTYAVQSGDLMIGAIVAVNALGDVFDVDTGKEIAGMLCEDGKTFDVTDKAMWESVQIDKNVFTGNTTIGFLITNADLTKDQCNKLADMAHDGYARAIKPVHTSADGDTIFFLAKGDVQVNQDALGDLGAYVMAKAINDAVRSAESAYGAKAARDL